MVQKLERIVEDMNEEKMVGGLSELECKWKDIW